MTHAGTPLTIAKPFLKWAGGKRQLLAQIDARLPAELKNGRIHRYVEPFIGGSAVFFHVAQSYPAREYYISDQNRDLILAYQTLQHSVEEVIALLMEMQRQYHALAKDEQEKFFYQVRAEFNQSVGKATAVGLPDPACETAPCETAQIRKTAQLIFLNRTCFNGLFRVNTKGAFNVPFGRYERPTICDAPNLRAAAAVLQRAEIRHADFEVCRSLVDTHAFVYFDPPYRPLSKSASFTAYASHTFDDAEQMRLAAFYRELDGRCAKLMLSNSDPHNTNPDDHFFQRLYQGYHIHKVYASRAINSKSAQRGKISELLITNYTTF